MRSFHQLSYHERNKIYSGLCEGKNKTAIARDLGRPLSTITREIHRNSDHIGYFYPGKAHEQAQSRRNKNKPKITKSAELRQYIIERLYDRWSPKVIAGRWNLENNGQTISKEAIYQWIYSDEGEEFGLKKLLVRARKKRGLKRKVKKTPINERVNNMPRASLGYKTPLEVVQIMESRDEACPAGNGGIFYLKKFDVAFHP